MTKGTITHPVNYWTRPGLMSNQVIIDIVCQAYNANPAEVLGKCRRRDLCEPRQVIASIARDCLYQQLTVGQLRIKVKHSLSSIGMMFSPAKDHATVLHSCKVVKNLYEYDKAFRDRYDMILARLRTNGIKKVKSQYPKGTGRAKDAV